MIPLRDFLWQNPWALALSTLGGLIGLVAIVLPPIYRTLRFIRVATATSLKQARRRLAYHETAVAVRCADDPSFYISSFIAIVVMHLIPIVFLSFNVADGFDPRLNRAASHAVQTTNNVVTVLAMMAVTLGIVLLVYRVFRLATRVLAVSNLRYARARQARGIRLRRPVRPSHASGSRH